MVFRQLFRSGMAQTASASPASAEERLESILVLAASMSPELAAKAAVLFVDTGRMLRDFFHTVRLGVAARGIGGGVLDAPPPLGSVVQLVRVTPGNDNGEKDVRRGARAKPRRRRRRKRARTSPV